MKEKERQAEKFSEKEAQRRFEAALRGARHVGPTPMHSMTPKRRKAQRTKPPARKGRG